MYENSLSLGIYKLYDDVSDVTFATSGAACFDIRAYTKDQKIRVYSLYNDETFILNRSINEFRLPAKCRALIPTGLILDIPVNHSVRIHPRSSYALKYGIALANCEGIIDYDYTDPLFILIENNSSISFSVKHGDRIAQGELIENLNYNIRYTTDAPSRTETNRTGGFGSTGR